jgi:hypothetical protein
MVSFRAIFVRDLAQRKAAHVLSRYQINEIQVGGNTAAETEYRTCLFDHLDYFGILVGRQIIKNYYGTGY